MVSRTTYGKKAQSSPWFNAYRSPSGRRVGCVGEEIFDGEPHTYVENSIWNRRGGPGTASELVVDRHGYVHVAGTVLVNGEGKIALTTYHP